MATSTLAPIYQLREQSADSKELILVEQEAWRAYTGTVTALNLVRYLAKVLYSEEWQAKVDCGFTGDDLVIVLYVYPLYPGVTHRLVATAGQLSGGVEESLHETETVTFDLSQAVTLKHPATDIINAKWLTGPYVAGGSKIAPPTLSIEGQDLVAPLPVFGSVQVTTRVSRTTYVLSIPGDEAQELLKNGWSEYAVGMSVGGIPVGLELTAPPGAEEMAENGTPCGRSSHVTVTGPEEGEPTGQKHNKRRNYDYCTLEFLGETVS